MPTTPERASQTSYIPFPDFKGTKRWLGRMSTPLALSILAACGAPDVRAVGGNLPIPTVAGDSSEVNAQNTAIAGANTTSAANEASATVQAGGKIPPEGTQTPKEAPNPEVKKIEAFQYDLLPPELRDTAELIHFKNKLGIWVTILAWKEVDKKFSITAPGLGSFSRNLDDGHKSTIDVDTNAYRITINLFGDLVYPTTNIAYPIKPGEKKTVANIANTGYKRAWGPEKFALVVGASATLGDGSPSPEEILRQFSSKAFEKPARIVEAEYDPNPEISSAISVSPRR